MRDKDKSKESEVLQSVDLIFESGDEFTNRDTYRRIMTNMKGKFFHISLILFRQKSTFHGIQGMHLNLISDDLELL